MMKKAICAIASFIAMCCAVSASAQTPKIFVNGDELSFEVDPYIEDDLTMVPFRAIFEKAGADVMWDETTKTVVAVKSAESGAKSVVLQIDSEEAFANDAMITLEKPAVIKDDYTFVPLRFVMESLGANVEWDGDNYAVKITVE